MESKRSIFWRCMHKPYGLYNPRNFFWDVKGSKSIIQRLQLQVKLPVHNGCVNTISWNDSGECLLSGSDDQHLCITHAYTHKILASIHSGHRANIFSAKFLPNTRDRQIISCSGDGTIMYTEVERPELYGVNSFDCHFGTAYEIVTVPNDPYSFLSCGEDGTVRWFDLRMKTKCNVEDCIEDILINCRRAVTSLTVNSLTPYHLAVGCSDSTVRLFDRRMLGTRATGNYTGRGIQGMFCRFIAPSLEGKSHRITSLQYSPDGWEVLVSYSSEYVYLFNIKDMKNGDPKKFSPATKPFDTESSANQNTPPMKKLRLRGDWSDTGPKARPESELQQGERSAHVTLMQRMYDMFSRWFEDSTRLRQEGRQPRNPDASVSGESSQMLETQSTNPNEISGESTTVLPPVPEASTSGCSDSGNQLNVNNSEISTSLAENTSVPSSQTISVESETTINISDFSEISQSSSVSDLLSEPVSQFSSVSKPTLVMTDNEAVTSESSHQEVASLTNNSQDAASVAPHCSSQPETPLIPSATSHVTPVISLHYSSQGTNSGLITIDLAKTPVIENQSALGASELTSSRFQSLDSNLRSPVDKQSNSALELNKTPDNEMELSASEDVDNSKKENMEVKSQLSADTEMEIGLESDHESEGQVSTGEAKMEVQSTDNSVGASSSKSVSENNLPPTVEPSSAEQIPSTSSGIQASEYVGDILALSERREDREPLLRRTSDPGQSGTGAISRNRRLGVSVDFNVEDFSWQSSEEEHSSDDDVGLRIRNRRRGGPSQLLEIPEQECRNNAARRIQELFRKCEKEKEEIELMSIPQPSVKISFTGHRNARTMIKEANFWGEHFVMSGSDCGHIFIWDRHTAELVMIMEADHHVVNCLQPHPFDPVLATSGIDYDIKLWSPLADEPGFDSELAQQIIRRNEIMLEETRDTITVPASVMIRMLASLNHIRAGRFHVP